ncbi:MAG TPA: hypothetical protein VFG29_12890 [Syntrophales bacterium]|nr:hypothetical protein [Syntrophales bacterium]
MITGNAVLGKKTEELLSCQKKEIMPIVRKLNTYTKKVREDIENKKISEVEGEKLIFKTAMRISMLTKI